MYRQICVTMMVLHMVGSVAVSQIVTFSDPAEWMTQRSDKITAKVQLDTAQIPGKKIKMGLYSVVGGRKKPIGQAQTFSIRDFSEEFNLSSTGRKIIGGRDYLGIEWSIPGKTDKGICEPFGVIVSGEWPPSDLEGIRKIDDALDGVAAIGALGAGVVRKVGGFDVAMAWNNQALWVGCRKSVSAGAIEFAIDGKNGKNAFVAYPDRFIRLIPSKDSVHAFHYRRALKDGTIEYTVEKWDQETVTVTNNEWLVAGVRWHDIGIIASPDRAFGFSIFSIDENDKVIAQSPTRSEREVPGTWGDAQLKQ